MKNLQPGSLTIDQNSVPATDFDNMSEEDLTRLINAAHRAKTGRQGRVAPARPPKAERIVDLDKILEANNG